MGMFKNTKNIAVAAITAALYVCITLLIAPFSYGYIQFRISEVMCLLSFFNPAYGVGVVIGCFFANLASPFGMLDVVVGTCCSALSVYAISKSKNLFIASLWPTLFCLPVGAMISYMSNINFFVTTAFIMCSEFIVVSLIGYPIFAFICKNSRIYGFLKYDLDISERL